MEDEKRYYKFLTPDHRGYFSGFYYGSYLPAGDVPGAKLPTVSVLSVCDSGYHVTDREHLACWVDAELYQVLPSGDHLQLPEGADKQVFSDMFMVRKIDTWNAFTQRQFGLVCLLPLKKHIKSPDSLKALEILKRYCAGKATAAQLMLAHELSVQGRKNLGSLSLMLRLSNDDFAIAKYLEYLCESDQDISGNMKTVTFSLISIRYFRSRLKTRVDIEREYSAKLCKLIGI